MRKKPARAFLFLLAAMGLVQGGCTPGEALEDSWTLVGQTLEKGPGNAALAHASGAGRDAVSEGYAERFLSLYGKLHDPRNGYFSPDGIPYHSIETLICEAPDYGHETSSETFSYWIWLEVMYGRLTGDWAPLDKAWKVMEAIAIPAYQPTIGSYNDFSPALFAPELDLPDQYPAPLKQTTEAPVGQDPISWELRAAHGQAIYGMHWIFDTDNWYGYGGAGKKPVVINTFQRGPEESVWETVPHPSVEAFQWGKAGEGFLSLFTQDSSGYKRQWRYTNAPDADARVVQAMYWAKKYADSQGGSDLVDGLLPKAAKMGDFLRYALFDKYFKPIGCQSPRCATGAGYESAHYLVSWYYAWGGSHPDDGNGWSWRIGSSQAHFGYQNPMAAWALGNDPALKPASPNGARDWQQSLKRQIEFYQWLQSPQGAIGGGATSSWNGRYDPYPAGKSTFYKMAYDDNPVYHDPGSNTWFGWQAWSMERVAEYFLVTGDPAAQALLDRWVAWVRAEVSLLADGGYDIPATLQWEGEPSPWGSSGSPASTLRVTVTETTKDVGITAALAKTLAYYSAAKGQHNGKLDEPSRALAKELLDRMWNLYQDDQGVSTAETRKDYNRFTQGVYVPKGWSGRMANGEKVEPGATFLSLRSAYPKDPDWPKVKAYLEGGEPPVFRYHRFWAEVDIALANAEYGRLFP